MNRTIYLIRHGQASFGAQNYDQLSPIGHEQSRVLGKALHSRIPRVDAVYLGSMVRHRETAEACLAEMGVQAPQLKRPEFNEFDFVEVLAKFDPGFADRMAFAASGDSTPSQHREFQRFFTSAVDRWMSGQHDAEYAQSWPMFRSRCLTAIHDIAEKMSPPSVTLVFTSGGPISTIVQELIGLSKAQTLRLQGNLTNASVTKLVQREGGHLRLSSLNEHGHLEGQDGLVTYR